jgi:DNA-binding transcriptional LysR family regulator
MDLQWLEDVLVLLEERNLTRAAARRNITQPAFSRRIRSFENWLGVEVLERSTNRVDLSTSLVSNEAEIRALVTRIQNFRSKIAHFNPASSTVSITAQHAPAFSTFPEMALRAKQPFPEIKFRLHAANLRDCMTMFLRGDADMLLCYEAEGAVPLSFDTSIRRGNWGVDHLIPVVGGGMRYAMKSNGDIPAQTPAIVYPNDSYFGEVLGAGARPFGTPRHCNNPVCETAFSSGVKELVIKGIGIGWLPHSMVYREIENGELISMADTLGKEPLTVAIYADSKDEVSMSLLNMWNGYGKLSEKGM